MLEHTTDRLFWTLSAIIVGALMLTVGVKIFPHAADAVIQPMSGLIRQADTTTSTSKTSIANALDGLGNNTDNATSTPGDAWTIGNSTTNNSSNNSNGVTTDQFNQLNNLVNSLKNQVSSDSLNIAQLNVSLNQANNKNDELNTKLNNALANQTASNNGANADLINQIKAKNDALYSQLNSMNQNYQSQGQQYATQIQALQQQLANVQSSQNDNNQNANSNSALTTQLAQQLSSAQSALQQLTATVTANNTQAQNLFSQYQAQIDQANQNSTDAENTANNASAQAQVNAGNISANSKAANNAQQTADNASSTANAASSAASNAANAASSAQTAATNAQNSVNNIFQARSYVFDNGESVLNAATMPDGYYRVTSAASDLPSDFSATGIVSVYKANGRAYLVLTTNQGNTVWTGNTDPSNPKGLVGWTKQAQVSDVTNNTNLINNLQDQFNNAPVIRNSLKSYGTDFNNFTENGIFSMGGSWSTDWTNGPDYDATSGPSFGRPGGIMLVNQAIPGNNETDIVQTVTTTNGTYSRTRFNGTWSQWARTDSTFGFQNYTFTPGTNVLDAYYKPSGFYHVAGANINTPDGFGGYGTLTKTQSSDYDQTLMLNDAQGNVWTNVYGNGSWQGWNKGSSGSAYIKNNDDLNNYTKTGDYASYNATGLSNSPYSYSLWFQLHVQTSAAFTTQTLTSSWGDTWVRTLSGSPAGWSQWVKLTTSFDVSNINQSINNNGSMINVLMSQTNDLINNSIQYKGAVSSNFDFLSKPGYTRNDIYDLSNQPYTSFANAYYPGNGIMVETISDGTNGRQLVWSTGSRTDANDPRLSYRVQSNGVWGRWILAASIDDVNAHQ